MVFSVAAGGRGAVGCRKNRRRLRIEGGSRGLSSLICYTACWRVLLQRRPPERSTHPKAMAARHEGEREWHRR